MAESFDRQIDRWQMLGDRVEAELTEVQKALVQATARQKEMAEEAAKLRQMKEQYLHDLAAQQQQDHSVEATTHLRRFLIHLDETVSAAVSANCISGVLPASAIAAPAPSIVCFI